jgi:hypothetical protein
VTFVRGAAAPFQNFVNFVISSERQRTGGEKKAVIQSFRDAVRPQGDNLWAVGNKRWGLIFPFRRQSSWGEKKRKGTEWNAR